MLRTRQVILIFVVSPLALASQAGGPNTDLPERPPALRDPARVLSADACVKCHTKEVQVWKRTPHYQTFEQMHRTPEAQRIAERLGLQSIKYEGRCVQCHYTQQQRDRDVVAISGVSCESCHGAARDWLDVHHDYGGPAVTRTTESEAHRQERIRESERRGMRNPHNAYRMAQACLGCHTVPDEELVNVGGHPAGSLDFEFVSWSQGAIRHNFVTSDGETNRPASPERMLKMFVCGLIADLESSLRATALATQYDVYGQTVAKRAARAAARIKSAYDKTEDTYLGEVLAVYATTQLILDNRQQLEAAADRIAEIGKDLADADLAPRMNDLQRYVPDESRWK